MTEVFSAIFGRKKPKAPLPPVSSSPESDGFEIVGQEAYPHANANNNNGRPLGLEEQDYETLFSFLQVQNGNCPPGSVASPPYPPGAARPVRRAPPVPNGGPTQLPYPLSPQQTDQGATTSVYRPAAEPANSSALYLSGVPFQVAASLGGAQAVRTELTDLCTILPVNLGEFNYSFSLERQTLDEAAQATSPSMQHPPVAAPRRRN